MTTTRIKPGRHRRPRSTPRPRPEHASPVEPWRRTAIPAPAPLLPEDLERLIRSGKSR